MRFVKRCFTAGDPLHERGRWLLGNACFVVAWVFRGLPWMVMGAVLVVVLGAPYVTRSLEESCYRVEGPEIDVVLGRHWVQRPYPLAQHVQSLAPLVAKGIMKAADVPQAEGWVVCPVFLRSSEREER